MRTRNWFVIGFVIVPSWNAFVMCKVRTSSACAGQEGVRRRLGLGSARRVRAGRLGNAKNPPLRGGLKAWGSGFGWAPLGHPLRGAPWALALALGLGYGPHYLGLGGLWAKRKAHALGHGPQLGQAACQ